MFVTTLATATKFRIEERAPFFKMLLPRNVTEAAESVLVTLRKSDEVGDHSHPEEEQMYLVLKGRGRLWIGDDEQLLRPQMIVHVPRGAVHRVQALTDELVYIYVSVWPNGIPARDKDWRKAWKLRRAGGRSGRSTARNA